MRRRKKSNHEVRSKLGLLSAITAVCTLTLFGKSLGMEEACSFDDLIKESDVILFGLVESVSYAEGQAPRALRKDYLEYKASVVPIHSCKGEMAALDHAGSEKLPDPIQVPYRLASPYADAGSSRVRFAPKPGLACLFFLKKTTKNHYELTDPAFGVFPCSKSMLQEQRMEDISDDLEEKKSEDKTIPGDNGISEEENSNARRERERVMGQIAPALADALRDTAIGWTEHMQLYELLISSGLPENLKQKFSESHRTYCSDLKKMIEESTPSK